MASDGDADLLWSMEHPDACSTCETVISSNNRCRCSPEARLSARVEKLESVLKFVRGEVLFYRETHAAGFVLKSALAACDGALDPTQPVHPVQPVTRSSVRSVGAHAPECVRTAHWQPNEGRYVDVSCTCGAIGTAAE